MIPRWSPRTWRFRSRLLAMLLLFTLAPLVVVDVFSIQETRQTLTTMISAEYDGAAQARAYRLVEVFTAQARMVQLLSVNETLFQLVRTANRTYPANSATARAAVADAEARWQALSDTDGVVQSITDNPVVKELRVLPAQFPSMVDLVLTDQYGAVIASTRRMSHLAMASEAWWQEAWNDGAGATVVMQGLLDRQGEGEGILLALPVVSSATGQTIGILRASYRFSILQETLAPYAGQDLPTTLVVDRTNRVLASTDVAFIGLTAPVASGTIGPHAHYGPDTLARDGDELFFADRSLPMSTKVTGVGALGWRVIVVQHRTVAFAPVDAHIIGAVIAGVVLLAAALGVAFFMGHLLSAPLTRLATLAKVGDLEQIATLPAHVGGDEIAQFARSLRGLAHHLLQSQEEIRAVNHGLEQTIVERTRALRHVVDEQQELLVTQWQLLAQIAAMPIPVLPVISGVVVIPLIGRLDRSRAALLANRLLAGVEQEHARVILLDITGVPIVDRQVAVALLQAIHAAQLLGAQTILVGVRPESAEALVDLDIDVGTLRTTSSLQEGLLQAQAAVRAHPT